MKTYIEFPDPRLANADGLLAVGGDLQPATLIAAYQKGIFPWFNDHQPILWWSPDPRLVLFPERFKCSRSLAKKIRNGSFAVTANSCFERVMEACATRGRTAAQPDQAPMSLASAASETDSSTLQVESDTWITSDMRAAYAQLHLLGVAHSIEVWRNKQLVGGLYGLKLGQIFFGESMFSVASDASKTATAYLCSWAQSSKIRLIDCQVHSDHLASLGAEPISRQQFVHELANHLTPASKEDGEKIAVAFLRLTPAIVLENVIKTV